MTMVLRQRSFCLRSAERDEGEQRGVLGFGGKATMSERTHEGYDIYMTEIIILFPSLYIMFREEKVRKKIQKQAKFSCYLLHGMG